MFILSMMVCATTHFTSCSIGIKTDEVFLTEESCNAALVRSIADFNANNLAATGVCGKIAGETA